MAAEGFRKLLTFNCKYHALRNVNLVAYLLENILFVEDPTCM